MSYGCGEQADAGHPGGPGFEAVEGIAAGNAAEGEDEGGGGELAGLLEEWEAGTGLDELAVDAFFEDGAEEEEVGFLCRVFWGANPPDVVEGVTGEADDGLREAGEAVELAEVARGELAGGAGEVDAVGARGDGDVGAAVEEEAGGGVGGTEDGEDLPGELREGAGGEVGLAEEEEVDAGKGEAVGLGEEVGEGLDGPL